MTLNDIKDAGHKRLEHFEEHGQSWCQCLDCGAQWGVHETLRPGYREGDDEDSAAGPDSYEEVSHGDEWCLNKVGPGA